MNLLESIIERAKADKQRIVLPEGTEERTLRAADLILSNGIADIILLGDEQSIKESAKKMGLNNIDKATIVNPKYRSSC